MWAIADVPDAPRRAGAQTIPWMGTEDGGYLARVPRTSARTSVDRLLDAADALEAHLTCPRHQLGGRVARLGAYTPSVDQDLWRLHVRYARRRRDADRAELTARYDYHVRRLSRRYFRHGEPTEDLEQVALEALLLALERFDPGRSLPFLGYANPTIVGALKRYYRDAGWAMRVPRRAHDLSSALRDAEDVLAQDLGRQPTDGEVADLLGVSLTEVRSTRAAQHARAALSVDSPRPDGEGSTQGIEIQEVEPGIDRVDDHVSIERVMRLLDPEARELIALYFEDQLTQSEIGERLGVSQMQVSRRLARALQQVRSHLPDA
jgi:RNA polymerase sigma-B factor